jgi:hypothetical protein
MTLRGAFHFFDFMTNRKDGVAPVVAVEQSSSSAAIPQIGNIMISFTSILKSIGHAFHVGATKAVELEAKALPIEQKIDAAISLYSPSLGAAIGVGIVTVQGLVAVIGNVEQIATAVGATDGTGPQKLLAAVPLVESAILADPLFKGKTIADFPKWNDAITKLTSALADLTNSVESATAPVTSAATTAAPVATAMSGTQPATVSLK